MLYTLPKKTLSAWGSPTNIPRCSNRMNKKRDSKSENHKYKKLLKYYNV